MKPIETIWTGAARFNNTESHLLRHLMAKLAREGQNPQALFITCADSRIVPSAITGTGPGDLFTMRNIGNLVPIGDTSASSEASPGYVEPSMGAALAYALEVLQTPTIIVCGHSECGAMKAVASGDICDADPHLQTWLSHAAEAVRRLDAGHAPDPTLPRHDQLAQINAVQQTENLSVYPVVARALREARVEIHAWYFDLAQTEVQVYDPHQRKFIRLEETNVQKSAVPAPVAPALGNGQDFRRKSSDSRWGGSRQETGRILLGFSPPVKGEDRCA